MSVTVNVILIHIGINIIYYYIFLIVVYLIRIIYNVNI